MKIYHYNKTTGEYIGEITARQSPLEPGVYLMPAYSTVTAPPACATGMVAVFSGGAWQ